MAKDPVCGMQIDKLHAEGEGLTSDYQGQKYYFCSKECKQEFDKNPKSFASQQQQSSSTAS